jgi:hypothetical protein
MTILKNYVLYTIIKRFYKTLNFKHLMKSKLIPLCAAIILLLPMSVSFAQDKSPVKFGKISPEDFDLSKHHFDTSVNAVVIADIGTSYFEGNSKGWFTLYFKRQKRVKILNRNGFDAANEDVYLFSKAQDEEKLENLKAVTYNLENGQVIETKLEGSSIFKEKISRNLVRKKFTFPAVKENSIIEFSYTVSSDFLFNLQPWTFQGEYPCLWSEYQIALPEFFNYVSLSQGYIPYFIKKSTNSYKSFNVMQPGVSLTSSSEHISLTGNVTNTRWVIKDVPAIKEENYTSTLRNHVSKIEFQLSQYRFPNQPVKDIMGNWVSASEALMKDEDFGMAIEKDNNWLNDDMKAIVGSATNPLEKANKIYCFVRNNFTCTDYSDVKLNNSLKTIFKNKNGSVSDINLLLVTMLRHENIKTDPLLLSTRQHGVASDLYPLMDRFNYVIAAAHVDDNTYYLDATRPLGFGKLAGDCYNGVGRIISKEPSAVYFETDSLKEQKFTNVFIINNDKGVLEGSFKSLLGYIESSNAREKITKSGTESFYKKLKSGYGSDFKIFNEGIDSLKVLEEPVAVRFDFIMDTHNEDILYFNPLMSEGYKENLFKAAQRNYPVEMPFTMNETFVLNMEIPKDYVLDEMPKSAKVDFNSGEGYFEYLIGKTANGLQLRSRVVLKKANFSPEDYNSLRDFFGYVVKKHSEQIVFKKQH